MTTLHSIGSLHGCCGLLMARSVHLLEDDDHAEQKRKRYVSDLEFMI